MLYLEEIDSDVHSVALLTYLTPYKKILSPSNVFLFIAPSYLY